MNVQSIHVPLRMYIPTMKNKPVILDMCSIHVPLRMYDSICKVASIEGNIKYGIRTPIRRNHNSVYEQFVFDMINKNFYDNQ